MGQFKFARTVVVGFAAAAGAVVMAGSAAADVTAANEAGFQVVEKASLKASPETVWKTLIHPEQWWNSSHTWSGSAANLSLSAKPGGCFCEKTPGGGVEHLRVVYVRAGSDLRLTGGLGPLQLYAVAGAMIIHIEPDGTGSKLSLTYNVSGWAKDGLGQWPAAVDGVLAEQVGRLQRKLDTGKPD